MICLMKTYIIRKKTKIIKVINSYNQLISNLNNHNIIINWKQIIITKIKWIHIMIKIILKLFNKNPNKIKL